MSIDVANSDLLLSTTRSVRKRLDFDRPVEREVLLECLQLAVQAPTASNRQTWRWMVVTDADLKLQVADFYREAALPYLRRVAGEGRRQAATRPRSGSTTAPCTWPRTWRRRRRFVIPCIDEDLAGTDGPARSSPLGSIVQAGWSFQLALRARGLGSTWTTLHLRRRQGGRRAARHPRRRHPGEPDPGRLHQGNRFQAGQARPGAPRSPTSITGTPTAPPRHRRQRPASA